MRIFISYARVDKAFALRVGELIAVQHETWHDNRLYAGQNWWEEILHRLHWCEGFVYLLSPDSVRSDYCIKEFEIAAQSGKHIFPILIQENTLIPDALKDIQYVDFSTGITRDALSFLLRSIHSAELQPKNSFPVTDVSFQSEMNLEAILKHFDDAFGREEFDRAIFLLTRARENYHQSTSMNILLEAATALLEKQAYEREARREYQAIAPLIKYQRTRKLGLEAFRAFSQVFPDYDPQGFSSLLSETPPVNGHIFLSYSHKDTAIMQQLKEDLEASGLKIWVDETGLEPGLRSWKRTIQNAIDSLVCVLVILSPDAKESEWVEAELDYAETQEKPIFSIMARGNKRTAVPFGFTLTQWIDIVNKDYDMEIRKLIEIIRRRISSP